MMDSDFKTGHWRAETAEQLLINKNWWKMKETDSIVTLKYKKFAIWKGRNAL